MGMKKIIEEFSKAFSSVPLVVGVYIPDISNTNYIVGNQEPIIEEDTKPKNESGLIKKIEGNNYSLRKQFKKDCNACEKAVKNDSKLETLDWFRYFSSFP